MLKVTIELWPFGLEEGKKTLHQFDIANDGSGSPWKGSYLVKYDGKEWEASGVENWPRAEKDALELTYNVLKNKYD